MGGQEIQPGQTLLGDVRVLEVADEQAEYAGLLLGGLGAEVIKIEPPGGSPTRRIGPFYQDEEDPNGSLFFWHYNRGKRSIVLDPGEAADSDRLNALLQTVDVLLISSSAPGAECFNLSTLSTEYPRLIIGHMTPFGSDGPWTGYKASDLIHLALGGPVMNCGYDPQPDGTYDLAPVAPQMWHAYHIAGEQLVIMLIAALVYRETSHLGQYVSCPVHQAVSTNTELDVMNWIMRRAPMFRLTCRHSAELQSGGPGDSPIMSVVPTIGNTKDGRWATVYLRHEDDEKLASFLDGYGMAADLASGPEPGAEHLEDTKPRVREIPGSQSQSERMAHRLEVFHRLTKKFTFDEVPWQSAQDAGLLCAPLRKPHENLSDAHWQRRSTFGSVQHPEQGRSFSYPCSKWLSDRTHWAVGRRAPLINEDEEIIREQVAELKDDDVTNNIGLNEILEVEGPQSALGGIRILDFGWFLATAGGSRFLAALGAQVIKVEWRSHPDSRLGANAPVGGRAARAGARQPLAGILDPDMGGQFNNKNSGKLGISLNVGHPSGLALAKRLVEICDVVTDGFSPGTMERWGLSYDVMRELNPKVIYVQQSAMGSRGRYGRIRTLGPVAAAFAGTSEMSGLSEPSMPAGWGYSYLDWIGAYSFASAIVSALYYRARTGYGQRIDASQVEAGIFISGTSILDWSANGREWRRYGNQSPYKRAAPHGIFRCCGADRWIAIACFTEHEWKALTEAVGHVAWTSDPRFATLESRYANQEVLNGYVESWTRGNDSYDLMHRLQNMGVPAGVCQTAEDRCDRDPQLKALKWLVDVNGTKIGEWPIPEVAVAMSATPPRVAGTTQRGAPCYGEDNRLVYHELLGIPENTICELRESNAI